MKYFKVKKEADQTIKPSKKYDVLVKDELYTETEINRFGWVEDKIASCFDKIEVSKKTTGFLFGARFSTAIER